MGYLNSQPGDDYLLGATADRGTAQLATPGTWEGTGQEIVQGLGGAVESIDNTAMDVSRWAQKFQPSWVKDSPLGLIPLPFNLAFEANMRDAMPDGWQQQYADSRDALEKYVNSDKQYHGFAAQTVGSAVKGFATFAPALLTGPAAPFVGGALVGGTAADDTYRGLTAQGVDDATAKEAAAAQGFIGAAGAMLPFKFGSVATKIVGGGLTNVGLGIAGRGANWAVLKANGYDSMAAMQRPLDRQSVLAELIVGAGMGLGAHFIESRAVSKLPVEERPAPSDVDAARVVADQAHAADSAFGIPTDPETAAAHQRIFDRAIDDWNESRNVQVTPEEARGLVENVVANPAHLAALRQMHEWASQYPELQTADALGPILDEAQARLDARAAERARQPVEAETGNQPDLTGKVSPDEIDDAAMRQLEALHGDALVEQDDGTVKTVREMANQMRENVANAESDHNLMAAAVACFARNGVPF